MDDTATAMHENVAPSYDTMDHTLIDPLGQDLPVQQVHVETHYVGTRTNGTNRQTTTESDPDLRFDSEGEINEAYVALSEDNHSSQVDSLALTIYRPSQHNEVDLQQPTTDEGLQDVLSGYQPNVLQEINEENIRLRLQRDDLLTQRIALENDLSTSFMDKFDLESRLSSANRTIDKGRAYYKTLEDEWKRDHAKLQDMTRLFEANTENERCVEMLGQQKLLEEENAWLFGQLQMKAEDNRLFVRQREAVVQASEYDRACAMTSEIRTLRQRLSTVQAQLADSDKAKKRLAGELQQERLKHRATIDAFELKTKMGSTPYNVQQTAYTGVSAPHKPSKFTSTYPTAFQAPVPKAGTPPQFSLERKSESIFGADPFLERCPTTTNIPQQYGARSKSKFSFGDNTVPESASTATETTNGATSRIDFNFTFGGTIDHHGSLSAQGMTTESDLPRDSTYPNNIAIGSAFSSNPEQTTSAGGSDSASKLSAKVTDNVNLLEGLETEMTAENKSPYNLTKSADLNANKKTQNARRKPVASDFFDEDPVKPEVKTNTMDVLAAEQNSEERVPIFSAGHDVAQQTHIGGQPNYSAIAQGSIQTSKDNKNHRMRARPNPTFTHSHPRNPLSSIQTPFKTTQEQSKDIKTRVSTEGG